MNWDWETVIGAIVLMAAWGAIALMMFEGQRIALRAEMKARVQVLAHKLYEAWKDETTFRIHTGIVITDEMGGDKNGNDTVRNDNRGADAS